MTELPMDAVIESSGNDIAFILGTLPNHLRQSISTRCQRFKIKILLSSRFLRTYKNKIMSIVLLNLSGNLNIILAFIMNLGYFSIAIFSAERLVDQVNRPNGNDITI
jgi:hypothetical protein